MTNLKLFTLRVVCLAAVALSWSTAGAQTVRFATNLGDIDVVLLPESAPLTVENFLRYARRGAYDNSFFHRSVRNFIIQGGGYTFQNNQPAAIPQDPPVRNEFRVSNTRGTIAMAKLGNDPNSATNQWFFNLANNSSNLNNQNGGFTVFGRVADAAGLAVMDRIAGVPVFDAGSPFDSLPLQNYRGGSVTAANLIIVNSITILEPTPVISGVISPGSFGGFASAAPGSYIEIYGSNLAGSSTREWASADFTDGRAPTSIERVSVTVDGKPAFVRFVSAGQVNVQIPGDVAVGGEVPVVVSFDDRASAPAMLAIRPVAGGLLAPPSFKVAEKQYVAALHNGTSNFVSNGSIPNVPAAPATPGETLNFFGVGFGNVNPGPVAGEIVTGIANTVGQIQFHFGDAQAQVLYAGLAPGFVGLYQFNVIVPSGLTSGDIPLRVTVDGQAIEQTLFIAVQAGT